MFEPRMRVIPQASDDLKACAQDIIGWLDKEMEGKTWVCGDRFTLADILLFTWLDFFVKPCGFRNSVCPNSKPIDGKNCQLISPSITSSKPVLSLWAYCL